MYQLNAAGQTPTLVSPRDVLFILTGKSTGWTSLYVYHEHLLDEPICVTHTECGDANTLSQFSRPVIEQTRQLDYGTVLQLDCGEGRASLEADGSFGPEAHNYTC